MKQNLLFKLSLNITKKGLSFEIIQNQIMACFNFEFLSIALNLMATLASYVVLIYIFGKESWCESINLCNAFAGALGVLYLLLIVILLCIFPCICDILISLLSKCITSPFDSRYEYIHEITFNDDDKWPLIYSKSYDITACGIENLHPFDAKKWGRIHDFLIDNGTFSARYVFLCFYIGDCIYVSILETFLYL